MKDRSAPAPAPAEVTDASIDLAVASARRFRGDVRKEDIDLHVHRDLRLTPSQWSAVVGVVTEQAQLPGRHDDTTNALVMEALLTATSLRALANRVDAVKRARTRHAATRPRRRA